MFVRGLWLIPFALLTLSCTIPAKAGGRYEYVLLSGQGHNNMDVTFATATDWIRRVAKQPRA